MTRCYELYCIVKKNPDTPICEDKVLRNKRYMKQYIKEMRKHGVKFDKTPKDKELFRAVRKKIGSERTVCQRERKHVSSTTWKNQLACPHCNKLIIVQKVGDRYKVEKASKKHEPNYLTIDPDEAERDANVEGDTFYH